MEKDVIVGWDQTVPMILGIKTPVMGNDGRLYQKLEIPGWYKGYKGYFEFIKDSKGVINHRFFKPKF